VTVGAVAKDPPVANFDVSPGASERTAGKTLTFEDRTNGSVTTPQFTFPDGTVSPPPGGRAVQKAFDRAGPVAVTMKVCWADDAANCATALQTVTILAAVVPPEASFSTGPAAAWVDATTAKVGQQVVFTNTSRGDATGVQWTVGGQSSSGNTATHTASAPGEVAVSLTVTNSAGSSTATAVIRFVDATAPKAAFSVSSPVPVGQPVAFTDQSTGRVTLYSWNFDDGERSTEPSPRHTYTRAGTFNVTLTVSNEYGESSISRQVTVEAPAQPNPNIEVTTSGGANQRSADSASSTAIRAGQPVTLRDTSNGAGVDMWEWNFGDNTRGTGQEVSHTWTRPGTYTVTLVVSGRFGSTSRQVTVTVT
jgi:PKD repeat protein